MIPGNDDRIADKKTNLRDLPRGGSRISPRRGRQSLGGGAPTQYFSRIF